LDIRRDLINLGIKSGDLLMVHVKFSCMGIQGAAEYGLLEALRDVTGPGGGILMPSFTTYLNHPSLWVRRALLPAEIDCVRDEIPVFDAAWHAPQSGLGVVARALAFHPDAERSWHPIYSFAGAGRRATNLLTDVPLDFALGATGVLGRAVDDGVKVLAIGLPWWERCTLFHLAEAMAPYRGRRVEVVPLRTPEGWVDSRQLVLHDGDFHSLAQSTPILSAGSVGGAIAWVVDGSVAVAEAAARLVRSRSLDQVVWSKYVGVTSAAPASIL